jgi:hypothetical protein
MYTWVQSMTLGVVLLLLHIAPTTAAQSDIEPEALVRAQIQALNAGNTAAVLTFFAPEARVFSVPQDPDRLVGAASDEMSTHEQRKSYFTAMLSRPPPRAELLDAVSAGDLVVAKLKLEPVSSSQPEYRLMIYRIREGQIHDQWQVARSDEDAAGPARETEEVVRKFAQANNRGDLEAFLALFSARAKNFRNSGEPHMLGDKPSVTMVDAKGRRAAYSKMFAKGAPAQVQTLGTVTLGNMIAAREVAKLPDGKVLDEISVYHIENGLILRDWFIFNEARP